MLITDDKPIRNTRYCPKCNGEFPAQNEGRRQNIIDTVRGSQYVVATIILNAECGDYERARKFLAGMHKQDRDALLLPGGVFEADQLELLK
jgi:hypothetical protein